MIRHGLLLCTGIDAHCHHLLVGGLALEHAAAGLFHGQRVGRNQATHHRLAKAPGCADGDLVTPASDGVGRKEDARGFGLRKQLHHHCQRHVLRRDPLPRAIGDRARVPQRRPALNRRMQHRVRAADVEEGLLLSGE